MFDRWFQNKSRVIIAAGVVVVIFFTLLVSTQLGGRGKPQPDDAAVPIMDDYKIGKIISGTSENTAAQQVRVGLYPINVYDLRPTEGTFYMTAYLWLRWQGDFDPVETMELNNAIEEWGLSVRYLSKEPEILPDGSKYQAMRISGRFFHPFDLNNYPLDRQELHLYVEDTQHSTQSLIYLPDEEGSGYDATLQIAGWQVKGLSGMPYVHDYQSAMGLADQGEKPTYSGLKFALVIERDNGFFIWKLLVPLIIVLVTNWFALLLQPKLIEVRTAMSATALLTSVFLQQAASDALPGWASLVLMDKIYVAAYLLIVITLIQIIVGSIILKEDDPAQCDKINRLDNFSFILQIIVFFVMLAVLLLPIM